MRLNKDGVTKGILLGRLEVVYNGTWGTVCDDNFGDVDAQVVCRTLGLGGGIASCCAASGEGRGQIWMDDVMCSGNESSLFECPFAGWGRHDCSHSEDVTVTCLPAGESYPPPSLPSPPSPPRPPSPPPSPFDCGALWASCEWGEPRCCNNSVCRESKCEDGGCAPIHWYCSECSAEGESCHRLYSLYSTETVCCNGLLCSEDTVEYTDYHNAFYGHCYDPQKCGYEGASCDVQSCCPETSRVTPPLTCISHNMTQSRTPSPTCRLSVSIASLDEPFSWNIGQPAYDPLDQFRGGVMVMSTDSVTSGPVCFPGNAATNFTWNVFPASAACRELGFAAGLALSTADAPSLAPVGNVGDSLAVTQPACSGATDAASLYSCYGVGLRNYNDYPNGHIPPSLVRPPPNPPGCRGSLALVCYGQSSGLDGVGAVGRTLLVNSSWPASDLPPKGGQLMLEINGVAGYVGATRGGPLPDNFTAAYACKQLGLGGGYFRRGAEYNLTLTAEAAAHAPRTALGATPLWAVDPLCTGTGYEENLLQCTAQGKYAFGAAVDVLELICTALPSNPPLELRLKWGGSAYGVVEAATNGAYAPIVWSYGEGQYPFHTQTFYNWRRQEATVACRQLGFAAGMARAEWLALDDFSYGWFWANNLICRGNETELKSCPLTSSAAGVALYRIPGPSARGYVAAVNCYPAPAVPAVVADGSTRLSDYNGTGTASGKVQILYSGVWGDVVHHWGTYDVPEYIFVLRAVALACKSVQLPGPSLALLTAGPVTEQELRERPVVNARCQGGETRLADCPSDSWPGLPLGYTFRLEARCNQTPPPAAPWTFKLTGGANFGILTASLNGDDVPVVLTDASGPAHGRWGPQEATVACRQLGFHVGAPFLPKIMGIPKPPGWLEPWWPGFMNTLRCRGNETGLDACPLVKDMYQVSKYIRYALLTCYPEGVALQQLYEAMGSPANLATPADWTNQTQCCALPWLKCTAGQRAVYKLELKHIRTYNLFQLSALTPALLELSINNALTSLEISNSSFTGTLPPDWVQLSNLTFLHIKGISGTDFGATGGLPREWGGFTLLQQLSLANNNYLTGPLPLEWGGLTSLQYLGVGNTKICGGALPTFFRGKVFNAVGAAITSLPFCNEGAALQQLHVAMGSPANMARPANWTSRSQYCALPWLKCTAQLVVYRLDLLHIRTASPFNLSALSLPLTQLMTNKELYFLEISNSSFTGTLPPDWVQLFTLKYIYIKGIAVSTFRANGGLPREWGGFPALQQLGLNNNNLTGPLPPDWSRLTTLQKLWLDNNTRIAGPIPSEWSNISNNIIHLGVGNTQICGGALPTYFVGKVFNAAGANISSLPLCNG